MVAHGTLARLILAACWLAILIFESAGAGAEQKVIVFFGDSLTAGYGIEKDQAFPALIQEKIAARGWRFSVVNAGKSGETSAGGLRRLDWVLKNRVDVLVLALGGNDGLRGIPTAETERNLQAIIDRTRQKYPNVKIVLAGMRVPPNLGEAYAREFRRVYAALARKNGCPLIPFLLDGVGGVRELNLPDGIHPTAEGHKIIAGNVWKVLEPVLAGL
ncbi:MAG TPA: arylesterase [Candidatus Acidoferrales bacterium]|nr:arylesterase [Candidatus Acidoferrales bacterium]